MQGGSNKENGSIRFYRANQIAKTCSWRVLLVVFIGCFIGCFWGLIAALEGYHNVDEMLEEDICALAVDSDHGRPDMHIVPGHIIEIGNKIERKKGARPYVH